jgi:hypothetical protein
MPATCSNCCCAISNRGPLDAGITSPGLSLPMRDLNGQSTASDSRLALPPKAAVLIVTVCSVAKRCR